MSLLLREPGGIGMYHDLPDSELEAVAGGPVMHLLTDVPQITKQMRECLPDSSAFTYLWIPLREHYTSHSTSELKLPRDYPNGYDQPPVKINEGV